MTLASALGEPGITAIATSIGEDELDPAAFASVRGTTPEIVRRWLGTMKIFTTRREATDLAADAAVKCLERASLGPEDIDAILWCSVAGLVGGRNELHVQQLLGAKNAFAIEAGSHCSELISTLWMAHMMVKSWPGVRRALVVCGEKHQNAWRGIGGMSAEVRYQPVLSDVGTAALIEAGGTTRLLSIGAATDASYWDAFVRVADRDPNALIRGMVDASALDALALQRCLEGSGMTTEDLHHYILTRESSEVVEGIVRRMHLDPKRIVYLDGGPSHGGVSDGLFGLEALMHGGRGVPNENVLVCSRTFGIARFGVIRLGNLQSEQAHRATR